MSITPEIIDPVYLYVSLTVFVKYDPNLTSLTSGELTSKVRNVISTYNDTNLKKFDGVFRHSQLLGEIDNADAAILNSTVNVGIQKRLVPTLNEAKKYVLDYNNGFEISGLYEVDDSIVFHAGTSLNLSLIHISEPTRLLSM